MGRALPRTPVGRQVAWFIEAVGSSDIDEASIAAHFAPSFLEQVSAAQLLALTPEMAWLASADIEQLEGTEVSASLLAVGEHRRLIWAQLEPSEPHRLVGLALLPAPPALARILDETPTLSVPLGDAVSERFGPIADGLPAGGIIVGVTQRGSHEVFAFGADPGLRYEIGSIGKTFTALLLAELAERGVVRLDAPVAVHLPNGTKVPREANREITLVDLATHTSGLPRELPKLGEGADPEDPFAHIDADRLYGELAATELESRIGRTFWYSNFGFALLGHALGRAAGRSPAKLVRTLITEPLGMPRTSFDSDVIDLAQGHARGEPARRWTGELFHAGGAMLTAPVEDMLRYADANIDPSETPLGPALLQTHLPRHPVRLPPGHRVGMSRKALGWNRIGLRDGSEALAHAGGTGGFRSILICHGPTGKGVVALSNAADAELEPATLGLLASLAGSLRRGVR